MGYYLTLFIGLICYIFLILIMKKFTNTKVTNAVFVLIILLCYIGIVVKAYMDVGTEDWNFKNTLPTANVSPFMFSTILLYFLLPSKPKKYYLTLISLLFVGMLLSPILSIVQRITTHYAFHYQFVLDYIAHFAISLWGIYLVKSEQVRLQKKNCFIGGSLIVFVAFVMFILNCIQGTAYFGLAINEQYNIYGMVLVESPYLSAPLYFAGLISVLIVGFLLQRLFNPVQNEN